MLFKVDDMTSLPLTTSNLNNDLKTSLHDLQKTRARITLYELLWQSTLILKDL